MENHLETRTPEKLWNASYIFALAISTFTAFSFYMNQSMLAGYLQSGGIGMTLQTETLKEELRGNHFRELFPIYNTTFGKAEDIDGPDYDLYTMARRRIEAGETMPEFIIACGSEEFIRSRVEGDVEALRRLNCRVRYEVPEGYTHDFEMWDLCIRKALDEWLPLKRRAIL